MESPETPIAPTFFRPHQPVIIDISNETTHTPNRIDLQVIYSSFFFVKQSRF